MTQFAAHKEYITRILLSPDVKKLATCSADHTAKIWEVDVDPESAAGSTDSSANTDDSPARANPIPSVVSGFNTNNSNGSEPGVTGFGAFGGSGSAGVGGGSMMGGTGRPFPLEATLQGHQRWVWDCAFSADSAYLVTACSDHYARLWELHSQQVIRQYNGHHRGAVCVALNDYSEARYSHNKMGV